MDDRTRLLKDAVRRTAPRRPVNPPIERAATLLNAKAETLRSNALGPSYGISGGQVHAVLKEALAELEHAKSVFLAPTGLAAITIAILAVVEAGVEVLVTDSVYWPTRRFCEHQRKSFGVAARFAPPRATANEQKAHSTKRTRLIILESPGSLTFEIQDSRAVADAAS